jgi:hypothetical protein
MIELKVAGVARWANAAATAYRADGSVGTFVLDGDSKS